MERSNLNISQWVYWLERDSILVAYYDQSTDKYTSPSEDDIKVTIFYVQRPDKFLLTGETPERDGFTVENNTYLGVALDSNVQMQDSSFWNQETEIPPQFHESIVARAIANGYERQADTLQLAGYFLNKYEAGVKEAKKYAVRQRDGSPLYTISLMDF